MVRIKDMSRVDMPREKLQKYGPDKLQNYELLGILLGSGIKNLNVLELSKKVLKLIEKKGIKNMVLRDLLEIKGLGKAKASQVIALLVLGSRLGGEEKQEILSEEDIWKLSSDIRSSKKEHFIAFYLDTQSCLIERQIISIGTLSSSLVHPREVFEPAVSFHAASIIVAHNHPSGSLVPSGADIELTRRLVEAGKILGIKLEKHVLLTEKRYLSIN